MSQTQPSTEGASRVPLLELMRASVWSVPRVLIWIFAIWVFSVPWTMAWDWSKQPPPQPPPILVAHGRYLPQQVLAPDRIQGDTVLMAGAMDFTIAGIIAWLLILTAREKVRLQKIRAADAEAHLQQLIAAPLTPIRPAVAMLGAGETAYAAIPGSLKKMQSVGFEAGTTGMSMRVAKGFSVRTSGTRGHIVKELVKIADGELVVTDKRIIFAGDATSFDLKLEKLLNVTQYADGFGFHVGKTTYNVQIRSESDRTAFAVVLDKVLQLRAGH